MIMKEQTMKGWEEHQAHEDESIEEYAKRTLYK